MKYTLISLIQVIANVLVLVIIADALLSFVLPPYHAIRLTLGRLLNPLYAPLRKVIPPIGMMDLTPLILLLLIQVLVSLLVSALR